MDIVRLYRKRFGARERTENDVIWAVLCKEFFQNHVRPSDTVMDLGAGYCEFINHIQCANKIAVDLNDDTSSYAGTDVQVLKSSGSDMKQVADASVDVVFASNFFEHLPSKGEFLKTLREIKRVLRPGGRLLILQPNLRFLHGEYWDSLDHRLPLTDRTVVEALKLVGLRVVESHPRFLPDNAGESRPSLHPWIVRLYLQVPPMQWLLGKQALIIAAKPCAS
jgi:SAM-dependent methyltransferase